MKTKRVLVLSSLALVFIMLFPSTAQAAIYQAYDAADICWPAPEVWLVVNTAYGRVIKLESVYVKWKAPVAIVTPLPSGIGPFLCKVWDDEGFYAEFGTFCEDKAGSGSGERTYMFYPHTNTWMHLRAKWWYAGGSWIVIPECKIDIYIGG